MNVLCTILTVLLIFYVCVLTFLHFKFISFSLTERCMHKSDSAVIHMSG